MKLQEYRKQIANLNANEQVLRDLYLRDLSLGKIQGPPTGYPSIDKPWLKYYTENYIRDEVPHMTAYDYLKKLNENNLELTAIDSDFGTYTYKELFENIEKTAKALYKKGVKNGKKVVVMLPTLPHESFILYGLDRVGAAMCPVPPQYKPIEVCNTINKFDADLFITFDFLLTPEMENTVYRDTNLKHIVNIGFGPIQNRDNRTISWSEFIEDGKNVEMPEIIRNPEDVLFFSGTGGSTGEPKSVMLNDNSFNIIVHQFINSDVDYCVGDRWIRLWPIFSASAAISNHHVTLCTGGCALLRNFPLNVNDFPEMIIKDKPNHIIMIPQLVDALEQSELLKNEDLSYIKTAGCGGLAISAQFEERINKWYKEHNIDTFLGFGYGNTEGATSIAMRSNFATTSVGTAGAPMVKTNVSIFDPETLEEIQYGKEGEICVNSEAIMMGYYKEEELTAEAIKTHPDGTKWLHPKDLGIMSSDGILTVKGRMTRMIFVFPTAKIYPQTIESLISKVPGVKEVVVCQTPDLEHDGFYLPVYFIVPYNNYDSEKVIENVEAKCNAELPDYSRPSEIYIKETLPLTKVGKPDVRALEAELKEKNAVKKIGCK